MQLTLPLWYKVLSAVLLTGLAAAGILSFSVAVIGGESPRKFEGWGEWGPEAKGLRCRVTTDRAEYEIGEAVRVLMEVRNPTDRPVALGLEPLVEVRSGLSRQSAEVHLSFTQEETGRLGFFSTFHISFPRGTKSEARAVVVQPKGTFAEVLTLRPWGPTFSSAPSTAQPGRMTLTAALWQFLSPDLKRTQVECKPVVIQVRAKRK